MINQAGGINGNSIKLIIEDSMTEPRAGVTGFRKLLQVDDVPAVITTLTSVAMAVRDLAENGRTVLLAESSHPDLTKGYNYTFRNFITTKGTSAKLTEYILENKISRIAVLHAEEEWGVSGLISIQEFAENHNFQIVSHQSFAKDSSDLRTQILKIKQSQPELIYVIGIGPVVASAYKQLLELGVSGIRVGFIICGQQELIDSAPTAFNNSLSLDITLDKNSQNYRLLEEKFHADYPKEQIDQSTVIAFEGVNIIANGFKYGVKSGAELRNYILSRKDFPGISGPIRFDVNGNAIRAISLNRIRNKECIPLQ